MHATWKLALGLLFPLTLAGLSRPSLSATVKGPNQINLTWGAVPDPGYGYLVEIQSAGDTRYTAWTELQPVPSASGYTDDPAGNHIYKPPTNGVATWVTEPQYLDPQDGTAAQFITAGLKPATRYKFRARVYCWNRMSDYSDYSNVVAATTAAYPMRYVAPSGSDSADGSATAPWATLSHAATALACGQVLMVAAGTYPSDAINMSQNCTAANKAVILLTPGAGAAVLVPKAGADRAIVLGGNNLVIDGISVLTATNDYEILLGGSHNALLNVETGAGWGVHLVHADHALIYRSYLHDAGTILNAGGGFPLTLEASAENVVWSNHFTRGAHDVSLCKGGCTHNRWLNNIMDGGWGMGFEAIEQSNNNLLEGSVIYHVQYLLGSTYKPCVELSSAHNTARRNLLIGCKTWAFEVSALYGGDSAQGILIYNNTIVEAGGCLFQSTNDGGGMGDAAYDGFIWANNTCSYTGPTATDMYRANVTSQVVASNFVGPTVGSKAFIWGHTAPAAAGGSQYPATLTDAQNNYSPPFSLNVSVPPRFIDALNGDYHLHSRSRVVSNAITITDSIWPVEKGWDGFTEPVN